MSINWKEIKIKPKGLVYELAVDSEIIQRVVYHSLWEKFKSHVVADNSDWTWNSVRVELWADSGRIIVYPSNSNKLERKENSFCVITYPYLMQYFDELLIKYENDEEVGSAMQAFLKGIAKQLLDTFQENLDLKKYKIAIHSADDPEPLHCM